MFLRKGTQALGHHQAQPDLSPVPAFAAPRLISVKDQFRLGWDGEGGSVPPAPGCGWTVDPALSRGTKCTPKL